MLQLAVSRAWPVHQLDVSNAFLHGHLTERVFCEQPTGFVDAEHPDHVCLLSRSLYGLKQAPRAWYQRMDGFLQQLGFSTTRSDTSLFIYHQGTATAYLLLYVDDIILTASSPGLLQQLTARLRDEFALVDLGALKKPRQGCRQDNVVHIEQQVRSGSALMIDEQRRVGAGCVKPKLL